MPLKAIDRIILIRVKVERAKKHLRDLAAFILALEHTEVIITNVDFSVPHHPITGLQAAPGRMRVPTLPIDVVSIAGDVVHNLRTALDHLAQHLAMVGCPSLSNKELRQVEFPIAETLAKYEADKARKVKGMRPETVEAIDRLKPYKGGNDALWRIHELDNIDKHRALFTMAPDFLFISDWFAGTYLLKTDNPDFSGVESKVEQDIQAEIKEAISKPQISQGGALLPSLHQLVDFVDNLIPSFEPLLK
jgi:hypothetical protein